MFSSLASNRAKIPPSKIRLRFPSTRPAASTPEWRSSTRGRSLPRFGGGLEVLPEHGEVSVQWTSADLRTGATAKVAADGDYSVALPNGQYAASLSASSLRLGDEQFQDLKIYNVGTVTVAGVGVTGKNLSLPELVTMDGQVSYAGSSVRRSIGLPRRPGRSRL